MHLGQYFNQTQETWWKLACLRHQWNCPCWRRSVPMFFGNTASCKTQVLYLQGVSIFILIHEQLIQFACDPFWSYLMRYLVHLSLQLHSQSWCGSKTCFETHHCTLQGFCGHIIDRFASKFGHQQRTNFFHFRWIKARHFGNLNHPFVHHFHRHS